MGDTVQRNNTIDEIKGIAIVLVFLGHAIQYYSGSAYLESGEYLNNILFKAIYSFHMPLFALISGYLFSFSVKKRTVQETLRSRVKSLLFPIMAWSVVNFAVDIAQNGCPQSLLGLVNHFFWTAMNTLWFLWAILICSLMVSVVHYVFHGNLVLYLLPCLLAFVTPDKFNLVYAKFLYPSFVVGFLWNGSKLRDRIFEVKRFRYKTLGALLIGVFIALLCLFNKDTYIYTSRVTLLGNQNISYQIYQDILRWSIGLVGSVSLIFLWGGVKHSSLSRTFLSAMGRNSLGMYVLNVFLNSNILYPMTCNWSTIYIGAFLTIPAIVFCYTIMMVLKKVPGSRWLLGGK